MKKKKAFTLVELLAVIVILAIILLIAVPNVMKIISNTKINAYNRQLDMLKDITKKYVASYKIPVTEDLNISLKELYDNNMVSDVKDPRCGKNFKENETIITVTRISDTQLLYSIIPETWCEGDATPPIINNINTNATSNSITVVVDATEDSGTIKKYFYSNDNGSNYIESTNSTYTFSNLNKDTNYEIKVIVENEAKLKTTSETITIKTSNIEGASFTVNPSGDVWAREKEVTITYPSDKGSLVYSYTLDGIIYTEVVGNTYTHKFSENSSIQARITDGTNTIDTTQSITKIDNEAPTIPTSGDIGSVSGSDTNGTIQTQASGSTDSGVGNITYKYLVTNNSTIPSKDDSGFTTSLNFTRSCGTSYYAYAIAEDSLGNRSEVKALGSTGDGVNSYSGWSSCSATCGDGTQTRTNSCHLVTANLSQKCNIISCTPTLIEKMEYEFGKSSGGCVPSGIPSGTSLYVDTNCAYAGLNGTGDKTYENATLKDPINNYIMFNGSKYRIMKVAKDGDGKVAIRALAPSNMIIEAYQFHTSNNAYWDNASIRTNLNTSGQVLYNKIVGPGGVASSNLSKLISMKYDKGTNIDCGPTGSYASWCGTNELLGWTVNSNYIGLPSIREFSQMRGKYYIWDKDANWAAIDSRPNNYAMTLSPIYTNGSPNSKPGVWTILNSNGQTFFSTTANGIYVRPVINIAPNIKIIGGNGSIDNPYILG